MIKIKIKILKMQFIMIFTISRRCSFETIILYYKFVIVYLRLVEIKFEMKIIDRTNDRWVFYRNVISLITLKSNLIITSKSIVFLKVPTRLCYIEMK